MKTSTIKVLSIILVAIVLVATLTACGSIVLDGNYYPGGDEKSLSYYEFKDSKATLYTMPGLPGMTYNYQIKR